MHFISLKSEFAKHNQGHNNKNLKTNRTTINFLLAVSQTANQSEILVANGAICSQLKNHSS
jgi:hypothetical protein